MSVRSPHPNPPPPGGREPRQFFLRSQSGFTLLELVVAITLMGLVLVMLYSGLRLGLTSWDNGEQRAETQRSLNHGFSYRCMGRVSPR